MYRQTEMQSCTTAVTYCCHDCHLRPRTTVWHSYGILSYAVLLFYSAVNVFCTYNTQYIHGITFQQSYVRPLVIFSPTLWYKDPNPNQYLCVYFTQCSRYTPWSMWKKIVSNSKKKLYSSARLDMWQTTPGVNIHIQPLYILFVHTGL